jgi:ABC-type transporter Mla MlaB component
VDPSAAPPPHPPGAVCWNAEPTTSSCTCGARSTPPPWPAGTPTGRQPGQDGVPLGPVVAVDASAAAFLNSTGVVLLVRETDAHRRAGGRPELRNPSRAVLRVLRLTGVAADLFDVVAG